MADRDAFIARRRVEFETFEENRISADLPLLLRRRYEAGLRRNRPYTPAEQDRQEAILRADGLLMPSWDDDENPYREVGREHARAVLP